MSGIVCVDCSVEFNHNLESLFCRARAQKKVCVKSNCMRLRGHQLCSHTRQCNLRDKFFFHSLSNLQCRVSNYSLLPAPSPLLSTPIKSSATSSSSGSYRVCVCVCTSRERRPRSFSSVTAAKGETPALNGEGTSAGVW